MTTPVATPPLSPTAPGAPRSGGDAAGPVRETVSHLSLEPTSEEIFRQLGYPRATAPSAATAESILRVVADARPHLHARGTFAIYPVSGQTERSVTIGGVLVRGQIGEYLHGANRLAVLLVTVGREISDFANARCRGGDTFGGWVTDAVGSWAAEAAANALQARLSAHLGSDEGLTLRYSPGYCGMELDQQRALFQLVQPEAVGVRLESSLLMTPLKSVSGIVGLGPRDAVGIALSPCDRCPMLGCHLRR